MKQQKSNKKRSYWGFFARTLAVMLAISVVAGLAACRGFIQYDISSQERDTRSRINKLTEWLRDPENSDATDAEIMTQLSFKTAATEGFVDCGVVLYDMKTGKTYDSHRILWCLVKVQDESTELIEAVKAASKQSPFLDSFNDSGAFVHQYVSEDTSVLDAFHRFEAQHPYSDCSITIDDVYVKDDHVIAGKGSIDVCSGASADVKESIPIAGPEQVPAGYVHFVQKDAAEIPADALAADTIFLVSVGSKQNSPALAEAHRMMDTYRDNPFCENETRSSLWEKLTQETVYWFHHTEGDANGDRWKLCTVTKYNFLLEHREHFLFFGTALTVLLILFSLLIAAIRYLRYSKEYELNEYRRNLTASLAHDLKSPLMAISGYAENLRDNIHAEKHTAYAESILQNTQYMDRLIADVLDLAKLEQSTSMQREACDLVAIAREAAAQFPSQEVTLEITGSCPANADPRMMAQALANLIGNAVKFTPAGGHIAITGADRQLTICNDIAAPIPDAESLLVPFVKGDAARGSRRGSGMGLSIAAQILRLHGFRFTVSAEGNRFTATIRC